MEKNIDMELFEKLAKLNRSLRHARHGVHGFHGPHGHGPAEGRGPCHNRMHHMPPEGKMPEAVPHGLRPHGPRRLPRERILAILNENGEGMHQREIAEVLMINPSSLSEAIDKLEADRYLERNVDPDDRRATLITLTEKGRARAYEVEDERAETLKSFFAPLTEDEKVQLCELISKLLEAENKPE